MKKVIKLLLILIIINLNLNYLNSGIIIYRIADSNIIDYSFENIEINLTQNTYTINGTLYENIDFNIYDLATFSDVILEKKNTIIITNTVSNLVYIPQTVQNKYIQNITTNLIPIYTNEIVTNNNFPPELYTTNQLFIGYETNVITNYYTREETIIDFSYYIRTNLITNIFIISPDLSENTFINLSLKNIKRKRMDAQNAISVIIDLYKSFLSNEWTACLRNYNIISSNAVITAYNTDSFQNMQYLLLLRELDTEPNKPTYSYFKNEFESFRINLEKFGVDMSNLP